MHYLWVAFICFIVPVVVAVALVIAGYVLGRKTPATNMSLRNPTRLVSNNPGNVHYVTYGDGTFAGISKRNFAQVQKDYPQWQFHMYSRKNLDKGFVQRHKDTLQHKVGGGLYLWKPYIVHHALIRLQDGDVLVYCDGGKRVTESMLPWLPIVHSSASGILTFLANDTDGYHTKGPVFRALGLNPQDPATANTQQLFAGIFVLQKRPNVVEAVVEWLRVSSIPGMLDPKKNNLGPHPTAYSPGAFRHDQSVFSLVAHQQHSTVLPEPKFVKKHMHGYQQKKKIYENTMQIRLGLRKMFGKA